MRDRESLRREKWFNIGVNSAIRTRFTTNTPLGVTVTAADFSTLEGATDTYATRIKYTTHHLDGM